MESQSRRGSVLRPPVQKIYDRQTGRCLEDIGELYELPAMVIERIKRAIEYTCKDVDRLNRKESGNGSTQEIFGNR